jgi:hypothetical protein
MRPLLLVAALSVAVCWAPAAAAQGPAQDSVTGRAANCVSLEEDLATCPPDLPLSYISLTADAVSGPSGQDPAGTMTWIERFVGGGALGETQVSCVSVSGNVAIIGVTGTRTLVGLFGRIPLMTAGLIRVTDGGGTESGLDSFEFELVQGPFPPSPPGPPLPGPTDCSSFPAGGEVRHNLGGDLVVYDAPPLPTSKDQCKNGGWQTYRVFKNQGQCVTFVATGGKTLPAGP